MPRSLFDDLVEDYDAARPSYPDDLYAALPPLAGAVVVELGAGTGIATRALLQRGATVRAVDISPTMLRRNVERAAGLQAVLAEAEHLPFADGTADLVCAAQAWHWVEVPTAAEEARRVLRPGGCLAVWWNYVDADGLAWYDAQQQRLEADSPGYRRTYRDRPYADELVATGLFTDARTSVHRWVRRIDLDTYEAWLRSKSYVDALADKRAGFLAAERASLSAAFPDGVVVEPFRTELTLAVARR